MKKVLRTWLLNSLFITGAIAKPCPPMEGNYVVSQRDEVNNSYYSNIFADAEHTRSWLEAYTTTGVTQPDPYTIKVIVNSNDEFKALYHGEAKPNILFSTNFSNRDWIFEASYKTNLGNDIYTNELTGHRIFANDITKYQYSIAKERYPDVLTKLPDYIVRSEIENPVTIRYLAHTSTEDNYELLRGFLKETPNGKHTQRVLNDFNLEPTSIFIEDGMDDYTVTIPVKPK